MIFQFYKKMFTRFTFIVMGVTIIIYLLTFIVFKTDLYIESTEYINDYLNYYIFEYLEGNISLLSNGVFYDMYIEADMQNLISAEYVYKLSHFTIPFLFLMLLTPFIVYQLTFNAFHSEVHEKASINFITIVGRTKFYFSKVVSTLLSIMTVVVVPRVVYLLLVIVFFNVGFSELHNLEGSILSYQVIDFYELNNLHFASMLLDILTLVFYTFSIFLISLLSIITAKSKRVGLLYFGLFLFIWYFLYETFTYGIDLKYIYWPDVINQFSFYRFAETLPTTVSLSVYVYQLLCILLLSGILLSTLNKREKIKI